MAALTPDVISPDTAGGFGIDYMQGLKHIRLSFLVTPWINNGDTYTPTNGSEVPIVAAAWEAQSGGNYPVVATVTEAEPKVTFGVTNADSKGYLHIWIPG